MIFSKQIEKKDYFDERFIDAAFETEEYAFDASILKNMLLKEVSKASNVEILVNSNICDIKKSGENYYI